MDWDYGKQNIDISISRQIQNTFLKFQHPIPQNIEDTLSKTDPKKYRANVQFAKEYDSKFALSEDSIRILKQNIVSLLFYGKAMDMTLLVALTNLVSA